jgi:hypothetical protein
MEMTRAQTEARGVVQDPHREADQDQVVVVMVVPEDHECPEMVSGLRGSLAPKASVQLEGDHRAIARNVQATAHTETDQLARKVTDLTAVGHKVTAHSVQVIVPTETDHHDLKATGHMETDQLARKVTDLTAVGHKVTAHSAQATAHTETDQLARKVTAHSVQVIVPTETDHHDLKATGHMETDQLARKVTGLTAVAHKVTAHSVQVIVPTETDHHDLKATGHMEVVHKATVRSGQVIVPTETAHRARKATAHMAVVHKATVLMEIDQLVLKATAPMAVARKVTAPSVQAIVPMAIVLSVRATALVNALGSKTLLSARCQRVGAESHVVEPAKLSSTMKMQGSPLMQRLVLRPRDRHSKMCGFAPMVPTCDAVAERRFKSQRSASVQTSVSCPPMSPPPFARRPNQQLHTGARCLFRT